MLPHPHPSLVDLITPLQELFDEVKRKALMRLQYDGVSVPGTVEQQAEAAMNRFVTHFLVFHSTSGARVCRSFSSNLNIAVIVDFM